MNNITKNTKTILFAAMIAAMILPFSGMQFATAEGQTNSEKIAESIEELKNLQTFQTSEYREQTNQQIQRLEISKTLEEFRERGLEKSPQAQSLYLALSNNIQANAVMIEGELTKDMPITIQSHYQYDTFATGLQINQSCGVTETGQTTGSLTQYHRVSYLVATPNYPSVLDCTKIHDKTTVRVTDLSGSLLNACRVNIPYSSGVTAFVTCNDFGLNDDRLTTNIILVESNAFYENGWLDTPFTLFYGWTQIVY